MIETDITILVNRKSDIDKIKEEIIAQEIQSPIFIIEYENHFELIFSSGYEQWEFDSAILECFPDYEFTQNLEKGRKEIRLQISRYQSELSTDNWGRPIEDPLRETKYLIKKSNNKIERVNGNIKVLFGSDERDYYVNMVDGINKSTDEKGFLLQNEFKTICEIGEAEILKDRLYKTPQEALKYGYYKMQELVNEDFNEYIENKKKEIRKKQRMPRKIIKDFIKSCNESDIEGIIRVIDDSIIFEKFIGWERQLLFDSIEGLKKYINSPDQELCSRKFSVKSNWIFDLPIVTVWIDYNTTSSDDKIIRKYDKWSFSFNDNKIKRITQL